MSSCLSTDPVPGEAGVLGPALLRPGQEVQCATASHSPLPETIGLRLPLTSAHASTTFKRFHLHPPAKGRRAVLRQPSPQCLQPEHLHVQLPETPASQGVHAQPGLGHLAALRHPGASAEAPSAAEVIALTYIIFIAVYVQLFSALLIYCPPFHNLLSDFDFFLLLILGSKFYSCL